MSEGEGRHPDISDCQEPPVCDGNKRMAAACFLLFLEKHHRLGPDPERLTISNDALAGLTKFTPPG